MCIYNVAGVWLWAGSWAMVHFLMYQISIEYLFSLGQFLWLASSH